MTFTYRNPHTDCGCEGYEGSWKPATDIIDTKDDYVLKMEVPGFNKEDMNIEFKDSILSVSGEVKQKEDSEDMSYHWTERQKGRFSRSFRLPRNVDGKKIDAKLKDGILELKVAKPEETKPKSIDIQLSNSN